MNYIKNKLKFILFSLVLILILSCSNSSNITSNPNTDINSNTQTKINAIPDRKPKEVKSNNISEVPLISSNPDTKSKEPIPSATTKDTTKIIVIPDTKPSLVIKLNESNHLYEIYDDPYETNNLYDEHPEIAKIMLKEMSDFLSLDPNRKSHSKNKDIKQTLKIDIKCDQESIWRKLFSKIINYSCDEKYLIIESDGLPYSINDSGEIYEHVIIAGIKNWNQQITLPQNYKSSNAWKIPINLIFVDKPMKLTGIGPIGVAINGVPIFDPTKQNGHTDTF